MLKKLVSYLTAFSMILLSVTAMAEDISKVDNGVYEFTHACMKDKQEELSMAGTYVEPKGTLTKDDDGNHVAIKFLRSDWMKKIQVEIDGKDVPHEEEAAEGTEFFVKFDVPNGEPKIRIKLYVVPMDADVAFRIVSNYDYKKISDDTSGAATAEAKSTEGDEASKAEAENLEAEGKKNEAKEIKTENKEAKTSNNEKANSNEPKLPQTGSNLNYKLILSVAAVLIGMGVFVKKIK
ncbi:MAG: NEAT domain-containing protein [Andreesenia angusta]|nr:NEAT domain-containing protein [Andreesenia angusta]